eukprot:TRINITY_DN13820_c0_g1_i2.p1 TRINITY_DN13820_c0_g1~~TRINITY_DN13820_c0_g1_i2.p1  ORF type:complete len:441 (+),score=126.66 TRINITY_DN13820_c0_g1_i2:63-1385(+)
MAEEDVGDAPRTSPAACADGVVQGVAALVGAAEAQEGGKRLVAMQDVVAQLEGRDAGLTAHDALEVIVSLIGKDEWMCVRALLFHSLAGVALAVRGGEPALDADAQRLVEGVVDRYLEHTPLAAWETREGMAELGAAVAAAGAHAARRPAAAAVWLLPALAALLRVLSEVQDCDDKRSEGEHHAHHPAHRETVLRFLSLANTLLDHAPAAAHAPPEVVQELRARLARIEAPKHGAAASEATLLASRLAQAGPGLSTAVMPVPATPPKAASPREHASKSAPTTPVKSATATAAAAGGSGRAYTEAEVKSFLYQRKLEWEQQLRKRDRALVAKTAELDTLKEKAEQLDASVVSLTEQLAGRDTECTELKATVDSLHQRNIETENKLEECNIFLREREHQVTILEGKNSTLHKEIAVLANESRVLAANNKELEAYVAELMEKV